MSTQWSAAVPTGRFQSKAEARMAAHLDLLKAAGELPGWAYIGCTAGYELFAGADYVKVGTYRPDFLIHLDAGVLVEVKGRVSRDFPLRMRLFRACYPDVPLHVVPSDEVENYNPKTWPPSRARAKKNRKKANG